MDLSNFGVEVKSNKPEEIIDENLNLNIEKIKNDFSSDEIERFLPWFLKYQLKNFSDLIMTSEIKKIIEFIENKKKYIKKKGLLLHGSAGSGKTTTLNLIGKHYNFEIFELNASDARNKKSIEQSVGDVIQQKSLFNQEKLILIDEVDGVSGTKDRGGVAQIVKFIKQSRFPLVFTANDIESNNIKALKKHCIVINFENHTYELLQHIAKRILKSEKIDFKEEDLTSFIEERSTSDIRGFINDLQANVIDGEFMINNQLEIRNYKKKIEDLMNKIYFSYPEDALFSSFNSDIKIDDLFLYLEENTPSVYGQKSQILAFIEIAKADVFRGRIMKWQYWRYLVYINFYLTYGVSTFKGSPKKFMLKRNQRILKKWIYGNRVNALRPRTKAEKKKNAPLRFIEKLAKLYGSSAKICRSRDLFYFALSYKNDRVFAKDMDIRLDIDAATQKALMGL